MRMERTERSETSARKIQTPENDPKERIQHSQHGESFKSGYSWKYFMYLRNSVAS